MYLSQTQTAYLETPISFLLFEVQYEEDTPADFVLRHINRAGSTLLAQDPEHLLDRSFFDLFPDGEQDWLGIFHRVAQNQQQFSMIHPGSKEGHSLHMDFFFHTFGLCGCFLTEYAGESEKPAAIPSYLDERPMTSTEKRFSKLFSHFGEDVAASAALTPTQLTNHWEIWSTCLNLLLSQPLSASIPQILSLLASTYGAEKSFAAFCTRPGFQFTWPCQSTDGIPAAFMTPTSSAASEWGNILTKKPQLWIPDIAQAVTDYDVLNGLSQRGIDSLYLIPLLTEGQFQGFLGLCNLNHPGNASSLLHMVARLTAQIMQKEQLETRNQSLRSHDPLTGYLNFNGFRQSARQLVEAYPDRLYALWYCDIRRFKYINDVFGYETGDRFLRYWADCIYKDSRDGELFCRVNADTMTLLLWYEHDWELRHRFEAMASTLNQFPLFTGKNFGADLIGGIYLLSRDDREELDITKMLDRANIAQKSVKGLSGSRLAFYSGEMWQRQLRELEITQQIQASMERGEIYVCYQPQYDYSEEKIIGAEALVRWNHPILGQISPGEFIPILEKNGFISNLDMFVWEEVCKYIRGLLDKDTALPLVPISINISRLDIYLPNLADLLLSYVHKYHLNPSMLKLEITESAYIDNPDQLIEAVSSLRAHGFSVEMDDFGSGYSSLNILKDVPVDVLKLDMKFLSNNRNSERGGSILSSIVRMAHWMGLPVIAEGVETREQADYLQGLGCRMMQGFYFARPCGAQDFALLLRQSSLGSSITYHTSDIGLDTTEFLSSKGKASFIFNRCIGGACMLEYDGSNVEALLMNRQFQKTLDISSADAEAYRTHIQDLFLSQDRGRLFACLEEAVETGTCLCELRTVPLVPGVASRLIRFSLRYLSAQDRRPVFFSLVENITTREMAALEPADHGSRLEETVAQMPGGLFRYAVGEPDHFDYVSPGLLQLLGYSREEFRTKFQNRFSRMIYEKDRARVLHEIATQFGQGKTRYCEYRIESASGELKWVCDDGKLLIDDQGKKWSYNVITDMESQKFGAKSLRWQTAQYHIMTEIQQSAVFDYNPRDDLMSICVNQMDGNPQETTVSYYMGARNFQFIHPEDQDKCHKALKEGLDRVTKGSIEFRSNVFGRNYHWCRAKYASFANDEGEVYRVVGLVEDIQDVTMLRQKATRDAMTGLLNHEATVQLVNDALQRRDPGVMFIIDIDDFKRINDTLGHLRGDAYLQQVSNAINQVFREEDIIGRIGGDEFLVFAQGQLDWSVAEKKAKQLERAFYDIIVPEIGHISASIGIALNDAGTYHSYEEIFEHADRSLYQKKDSVRNKYKFLVERGTEPLP